MKCSEYYGIQFAQGYYLMHWESAQFSAIVDRVFSCRDDISVYYEGFCQANGRKEVCTLFRKIKEMSIQNGGLLRLDMPHTQKITLNTAANTISNQIDEQAAILPHQQLATGHWETLTFKIMGAAFGNDLKQAPLEYAIGRYTNTFVLENGLWKILSIHWKPVITFGKWYAKDATAVYSRPYPQPFDTLKAVDDTTASPRAIANCNIRNQVMSFFHDFNHIGPDAIDGRFSTDAARNAKRMLITEKNVSLPGYHGTALVTSPIVEVYNINSNIAETSPTADIYVNVGLLLPVDDSHIAHSRGRVCAELELNNGLWKFTKFNWYRYATMEPWEITGI